MLCCLLSCCLLLLSTHFAFDSYFAEQMELCSKNVTFFVIACNQHVFKVMLSARKKLSKFIRRTKNNEKYFLKSKYIVHVKKMICDVKSYIATDHFLKIEKSRRQRIRVAKPAKNS